MMPKHLKRNVMGEVVLLFFYIQQPTKESNLSHNNVCSVVHVNTKKSTLTL